MTTATLDITTATPVEIDTVIAEIYRRGYVARAARDSKIGHMVDYREGIAKRDAGDRRYSCYNDAKLAELEAKVDALSAEVRAIFAEANPFEAEFTCRGGWTRAFLVTGTGTGHVHKSMWCNTCYPTTEFAWLPEMSGKDESEIVEAAGERACTVCHPSAPVATLARPTTLFSHDERIAQAARDAKAAAKAERDAAKATKAISNPDGSPLRSGSGWVIATERSAEIEYVDDAAYVTAVAAGYPHVGRLDTAADYCNRFLAAVAAKHGTTVETEIARITPKVTARVKRDY